MALSTRGMEDPTVFHDHARDAVKQMEHDNAQMLKDLVADTRRLRQAKGSGLVIATEKLQHETAVLNRAIERERKRIEVQETEEGIMMIKKRIGGVNAPVENTRALHRHVQMLESRTMQAHQRYNKAVADNRRAVQRIDILRRERVIFDKVYRRLEADLQRKRRALQEVLSEAERAYRAREEAQGQISRLRASATAEAAEFDAQWREAARRLERDRGEKQTELEALRTVGELMAEEGCGRRGDEVGQAEKVAQGKLARGRWALASERMAVEANEDRMERFAAAMERIKAESGIESPEELVRRYLEVEERKYSLFSHAGELSAELERTEAAVADAAREVEALEEEAEQRRIRSGRARVLGALAERRDRDNARAAELEQASQGQLEEVARLRGGIAALFATVDGSSSVLAEALTGSEVTDRSLMQHLGIIEQRMLELVRAYGAYGGGGGGGGGEEEEEEKEAEEERFVFSTSLPPQPELVAFSVQPPAVADLADQGADEDEERPLNRAELAERVGRSLGSLAGISVPALARSKSLKAEPVAEPLPPRVYTVELSS